MNTETLANHYTQMKPEERFRLILAAVDRGDEAERQRVKNAGKRITLSVVNYWPFAETFQEVAITFFLDLVEEAATYRDAFERWHDSEPMGIIDGKRGPATAKKDAPTIKERMRALQPVYFSSYSGFR